MQQNCKNHAVVVAPAAQYSYSASSAQRLAITEGEDKPLKYPVMFHACDVVVVNKLDLLPHLDLTSTFLSPT